MKKVEKLALVGVIVLLLCCGISSIVVLFSDTGLAITKDFFRFKAAQGQLASLEGEHPFKIPGGGLLDEGRLQLFIHVCTVVKPAADPVDSYHPASRDNRRHGEPHGGVPLAPSATFLQAMATALEADRMGPSEWLWISNQVAFARDGTKGNRELERLKEVRDALRKTAGDPNIPEHERRHLEREIERLEAAAPATEASAAANSALLSRYADALRSCAIGGRSRIVLSDALPERLGGHRALVFVDGPEGPPGPPDPPAQEAPHP